MLGRLGAALFIVGAFSTGSSFAQDRVDRFSRPNQIDTPQQWNADTRAGFILRGSTLQPSGFILMNSGGPAGTKAILSIKCSGEIEVRGKPYTGNDELAQVVREWGMQHCPKRSAK